MKFDKPKKAGWKRRKLTPADPLTEREQTAADEIAMYLREGLATEPVGLFIWQVCQDHGVDDHKKVAKHLGQRRRF